MKLQKPPKVCRWRSHRLGRHGLEEWTSSFLLRVELLVEVVACSFHFLPASHSPSRPPILHPSE